MRPISRKTPTTRWATRSCRSALQHVRGNFIAKRAAAAARLPEFEALARQRPRHQDHTLAHLDLYLEAYERKVVESRRPRALRARPPRRRVDIVLDICAGARRQGGDQGQVDDLRGDRPQRRARGGGHRGGRDRSRRIYHPAARRGALAHHRAGDPRHRATTSRPTSARPTSDLPPDRDLSRPEQLLAEARAHPARQVPRPPTSASPAPISSSPRPGRRSSSPTRATATSPRSCRTVHVVIA